jgi:hypothetical protein
MWTKMPHFHEICTLPVFCTQVYVVYSGLHPIVQNQTKFKSPQNMIAHKGLQFQGFLIIPFREKKKRVPSSHSGFIIGFFTPLCPNE